MGKFSSWIDKQSDKYLFIHYDKKNRVKFRNFCWLIYLIIFLFILIASLLIGLSGLKFDPDNPDYYPYWVLTTIGQKVEFTFGLIIMLLDFAIGVFFAFYLPGIYKESQNKYFRTEKFKQIRIKHMTEDLSIFSLKELKWLKKLNYIDKVKYEQAKVAYLKAFKENKKQRKPA